MSGAAFDVRTVSPDDFGDVRALYRKVWQRERSETYDRMRFLETMDGPPDAATARADGELIGFFTLWPLSLTDGDVVVRAGEAMDVMTDDRYRGRGIFPTLAEKAVHGAASRGAKLLFGAPNAAIYAGYTKRLAWASPGFIRTYIRPLSLRGATPLAQLAAPGFALWPRSRAGGFEMRQERPSIAELTHCLDNDPPKRGRWRLHRTSAWYDYRYRDAGKFVYHWIAAWRGGEVAAFAIIGVSRDGGTRLRRANIADVVGSDPAARKAVIGAAVRSAESLGANFLAVTLTSAVRAVEFQRNGFVGYRRSPLIAKTLGPDAFAANPFLADGWDLIGADFDFI